MIESSLDPGTRSLDLPMGMVGQPLTRRPDQLGAHAAGRAESVEFREGVSA